jgi:hypothetical protein
MRHFVGQHLGFEGGNHAGVDIAFACEGVVDACNACAQKESMRMDFLAHGGGRLRKLEAVQEMAEGVVHEFAVIAGDQARGDGIRRGTWNGSPGNFRIANRPFRFNAQRLCAQAWFFLRQMGRQGIVEVIESPEEMEKEKQCPGEVPDLAEPCPEPLPTGDGLAFATLAPVFTELESQENQKAR